MTAQEQSTTPLPSRWMIAEATQDVIRRRLGYAPRDRVVALTEAEPDKVQQYLEWNRRYALVALHPPAEIGNISNRMKRFGQGFPGLFNVGGHARPHDLRPNAAAGPSFTGYLHVTRPGPVLVVAKNRFNIVVRTNCWFCIEPDASIAISGFVLRNHAGASKKFSYKVNFVYVIGFGSVFSPYYFVDEFERVLVYYFGMKAGDAPKTRHQQHGRYRSCT